MSVIIIKLDTLLILTSILTYSVLYRASSAAEIGAIESSGDVSIFYIAGEIRQGDYSTFSSLVRGARKGVVLLAGPGGAVDDSLEIGRVIRESGLVTAVPEETLCASACALIWLSGTQRYAEPSSFLGFHAAYTYKQGQAAESGKANALIGSYMNDLGYSDAAIEFVTNAPPEGIDRLSQMRGRQIGIPFSSMSNAPDANRHIGRPLAGPKVSNPIEVVSAFYQALTTANGEMAASFVVPEKRGKGPFNESNIAQFFGSMTSNLRVISIRMRDSDTVEVSYEYKRSNMSCSTTAIVKTTVYYGLRLISKINAKC